MAPWMDPEERFPQDIPAVAELAPLVCILLESLPFLEGSAPVALAALEALLPSPMPPAAVVIALRRGGDACAAALVEAETAELGDAAPALTAATAGRFEYAATELERRATQLESRGRRQHTAKATAAAGAWLMRLQAAAEALGGGEAPEPQRHTARTLFSNALQRADIVADADPAAVAAVPELPLSCTGPCAHVHDDDTAAFTEYAARWPVPAAFATVADGGGGSSSASTSVAALLPPACGPSAERQLPTVAAVAAVVRPPGAAWHGIAPADTAHAAELVTAQMPPPPPVAVATAALPPGIPSGIGSAPAAAPAEAAGAQGTAAAGGGAGGMERMLKDQALLQQLLSNPKLRGVREALLQRRQGVPNGDGGA